MKWIDKITEKLARTSHPRTKTISDLIKNQFKLKKFVIEKNKAKITKEDMEKEVKVFLRSIKKL